MTAVGVVLAGGASSRLGQPKALCEVGGVPSVVRITVAMQQAGLARVLVVTGPGGAPRGALQSLTGAEVLDDGPHRPPGQSGPLCGLAAAAHATPHGDVLVLWPADAPLVSPDVLRGLARQERSAHLVGMPLHAVVHAGDRKDAFHLLARGRTGLRPFWAGVPHRVLGEGTLSAWDPFGGWRVGFNTPAEWAGVERHLSACASVPGLLCRGHSP